MSKFINMYIKMLRKARDGWMKNTYHLKDAIEEKDKQIADLNIMIGSYRTERTLIFDAWNKQIAEAKDIVALLRSYFGDTEIYAEPFKTALKRAEEFYRRDINEIHD